MAELKTKPTDKCVEEFLNKVEPEEKRKDCYELLEIMKKATGEEAVMWGPSIVGFGQYHYKYASGREGDWMLVGFSPRKTNISIYIMSGFREYGDLLEKLGKHKTSVACLYVKSLKDIDTDILAKLIKKSVAYIKKHNK